MRGGGVGPGALSGLGALIRIGDRRAIAAELAHQHLGESDTSVSGHIARDLLVEHALVHLRLVVVEQAVAEAGLAHVLQHRMHEQRLELARRLAQRIGRVLARRLPQPAEALGIERRTRDIRPRYIRHGRLP